MANYALLGFRIRRLNPCTPRRRCYYTRVSITCGPEMHSFLDFTIQVEACGPAAEEEE